MNSPDLRVHGIKRQCGVALILVMGCLVLLSALAVSFFMSVKTDLRASKSYADGTSVKCLADSAMNLVQGTIIAATSGTDASGRPLAWASQPGMIRTYSTSGSMAAAYKLYSSGTMIVTGAMVDPGSEANALANWADAPAHFTDLNEPISTASGTNYPIMDPSAEGQIEGFLFTTLPSGVHKGEMPMGWLYILQNGRIVAPDTPSGITNIAKVTGASGTNPIVGRIAFWTDDECAKVNVNTASEGTFWDTPRVMATREKDLGRYQPAKNEFQRYPGHPAMTSLRTALPAITSGSMAFSIVPRIAPGGSMQGTVSNVASPVQVDTDRLYSSVDEIMFSPQRNTQGLTVANLAQSRFFVTAHSRAPEVNIFNQPRIAMWPIHANSGSNYRTTEDSLIAFCSTSSGSLGLRYPYYIQRADAASPTNDITQIARNGELFQYLQRLSQSSVPGFGGDFSTKYGADCDQILTEMVDYIRCANLNDQGVSNPFAPSGQVTPLYIASTDTLGFGRFPTIAEAGIAFAYVGNGTLTSGTTVVTATAVSSAQYPFYGGIDGNGRPPANREAIQAYFVMSFMNPSMGYPTYTPSFTIQIDGMNQLAISGTQMGFPSSGSTYISGTGVIFGHEPPAGGLDPRWFVIRKKFNAGSTDPLRFPFFSNIIELPTTKLGYNGTYFSFVGGTVTAKIYAGNSTNTADLVQTVEIPIPSGNFPPPWASGTEYRLIGTGGNSGGYGDRFANCDSANAGGTYRLFGSSSGAASDTLETVSIYSGDARIAFKRTVRATDNLYAQSLSNAAYPNVRSSFCANSGYSFFAGTKQGTFVSGTKSSLFSMPLPASVDGVYVDGSNGYPHGDFDNGIASMPDGPYINKSDEGDISGMSAGEVPYFKGWGQYSAVSTTYFSPNRQIPSSGMFGSLSSGVKAGKPWRTLLFHPDDPSASSHHPGASTPPDHLMMDLFWMPVVEPYPISEPFSTAGKVNLNCQIMPFAFIKRETGVRAVLKSERLLVVPQTKIQNYKNLNNIANAVLPDNDFRADINLDETMKGIEGRFSVNDIFRSASEICTIPLVPAITGVTYEDMVSTGSSGYFWNNYLLTGDNSRERPYANIYPRLTTKSNTYTVHYRVQMLKKRTADLNQDQWVEGNDQITGEYRGSSVIERYIDPNASIPDYATNVGAAALADFYKFRVISTKQVVP